MSDTADLLVSSYHTWLAGKVSAEILDSTTSELTTPFLDRHNDFIQVYAERRTNNTYLLTDDGYVISDLKSSGVENRGTRRSELFHQLLSGYGVEINGSELQTVATVADLGQRLHNLIQAMLSVDDMFVLSQNNVQSVFIDDVARFLDDRDIRYTPQAKFSGKSGLDHHVDFVIPKSRKAPERIVQVLNAPRRDRVENLLFSVSDTRESRGPDTAYYALVNDAKQSLGSDSLKAFERYSVTVKSWSQRDELVEALAA